MVKYNEAIRALQETIKKSEDDKKMLKQRIEDIIEENKKVENDFTYQINSLHKANSKLIKQMEIKSSKLISNDVSILIISFYEYDV